MAILANITVADSDLSAVFPDVNDYKFSSQTDFSDIVDRVKREVYRDIRAKSGKTNTEMDRIKDLNTTEIKDKIIYLSLAEIFLSNGALDLADSYRSRANAVPLNYYDDADADSTADDSEKEFRPHVTFGR